MGNFHRNNRNRRRITFPHRVGAIAPAHKSKDMDQIPSGFTLREFDLYVENYGAVSSCCGAEIIYGGICSDCREHCSPEPFENDEVERGEE